MAYDLYANNKELESFRLGYLPHLIEQCGVYFTCVSRGSRWYTLWDERMSTHHHDVDGDGVAEEIVDQKYPTILCNCGFEITEEEARVMARVARNWAAIQRTLEEPTEKEKIPAIDTPEYLRPFPEWMRRDWVEKYEQFAEWAEQSQGFKIY